MGVPTRTSPLSVLDDLRAGLYNQPRLDNLDNPTTAATAARDTRMNRQTWKLVALRADYCMAPHWRFVAVVGSDGRNGHALDATTGANLGWLPWPTLRHLGPSPTCVPSVDTDLLTCSDNPTIRID
jgi:hypothetical protein